MAVNVAIEIVDTVDVGVELVDVVEAVVVLDNTIAGKNVVIPDLTCQELNDSLTQAQRDEIQQISPMKTGQTVSFDPFDDGATELGRGVDFFTLDCNNSFGNTNRFTDINGLQVYGNDYLIDHLSKLGWKRTLQGAGNFALQLSNADALTFAGFNDWRVGNVKEYMTICNYAIRNLFNWVPMNIPGVGNQRLWTSNTRGTASTLGITYRTDNIQMEQAAKIANNRAIVCRNHF